MASFLVSPGLLLPLALREIDPRGTTLRSMRPACCEARARARAFARVSTWTTLAEEFEPMPDTPGKCPKNFPVDPSYSHSFICLSSCFPLFSLSFLNSGPLASHRSTGLGWDMQLAQTTAPDSVPSGEPWGGVSRTLNVAETNPSVLSYARH